MEEKKCLWCGKYYDANPFIKTERSGFCSTACEAQWKADHAARVEAKQQAKIAKQEAKVEKKEAKLEKSKTTSDESLQRITKLCLVAGYVGVHRFAVGKIKSAILLVLWTLFIIYLTFFSGSGFAPRALSLLLVNVAVWLFDFMLLKAKKFTDKYGYTIRE